jgi:hypothetical protein
VREGEGGRVEFDVTRLEGVEGVIFADPNLVCMQVIRDCGRKQYHARQREDHPFGEGVFNVDSLLIVQERKSSRACQIKSTGLKTSESGEK